MVVCCVCGVNVRGFLLLLVVAVVLVVLVWVASRPMLRLRRRWFVVVLVVGGCGLGFCCVFLNEVWSPV